MSKITFPPASHATNRQVSYIEVLAIDLRFSCASRNNHILAVVGREIKYLDDLTVSEASKVIGKFKEWREGLNADKR